MTVVGEGVVPISADVDGLQRDIDRGLGKADNGIGSWAKKTAKIIGGAMAAGFALDFGRDAINSASDLNETVSKSRTIFGDASVSIEKWAGGAAKGIGQSKQQALDAAATFGNLFVQLGIGTGQAGDMSTAMVELASDFASFHNANPAEVIEAQTAAFRGEYDALQRFVPTINAAAVEQEALAMTGKKSTKELTLQEKALATQSLMMKGAGDAAGDFARTSDSLANKQRIQAAQWDDLTAKVGNAFLPAMNAVVGFIVDTVLPGIERFAGFLSGTVGPVVSDIAGVIGEKWGLVAEWTREHWGAIQEAVGHVLAVIEGLWDTFGGNILDAVKVVWGFIKDTIENQIKLVRSIIETVTALINGDWGKAWDGIKGIVSAVWDQIRNIVKTALGLAREAVQLGMDAIKGVFGLAWDGIKGAASGAVDAVVGFVRGLPGKLLGFGGNMLSAGLGLGGKFLDGLKDGLTAAAGFAGDIADGIVRVVKNAWNAVARLINDFVPNSIGWGPFKLDIPDNPIPQFRAMGGPVSAGSPYIVGERGPELFVPSSAGEIVPNDALGAGAGITVHQTIVAPEPVAAGRQAVLALRMAY